MHLVMPDAALVPPVLRAMKTVAMANGAFDARERELLEAVARIHRAEVDVDALEPITPEDLATAFVAPNLREQVVLLMILLSMIDGQATTDEVATIQRFAAALDVSSPEIARLENLAQGHVMAVRFDIGRRFWAREKIQEAVERRGVLGAIAMALTMLRVREDTPIAERYRALATYPEGSVGRVYHDHMRAEGFALPGEKGSPPEPIVLHDLTHVLSGYGTDPDGEVQTAAFHAGYRKQDPFTFLFFVMLQFHLGVRVTPIAQADTGHFDPERVIRAVERGAAMNTDLTLDWDPWTVMAMPLEDARRALGVPPP